MKRAQYFSIRKWNVFMLLSIYVWVLLCLSGCGASVSSSLPDDPVPSAPSSVADVVKAAPKSTGSSTRVPQFDKLPAPSAPGTESRGNDKVTLDISNTSFGYYFIEYKGDNGKVKMQVTGPDGITYTFNLKKQNICIPLVSGDGSYQLQVYENIKDDQYVAVYQDAFSVTLQNEFYPFLLPNYYVNYTDSSNAIALANDLSENASSDLEVVTNIYHYIIQNITYDDEEAVSVVYDYLPDVDEVLATKKGICFDYASLMAAMLRSQSIPTKLQVGYSGDVYHAWISTYLKDVGWVDDIIEFHGDTWTLMDPTFGASVKKASTLKKYIGDGSNYKTLYTY